MQDRKTKEEKLRLDPVDVEYADYWNEEEAVEQAEVFEYEVSNIIDVASGVVPHERASERFERDMDEFGDSPALPKIPSTKVMSAYQEYCDMGPGRTIAELQRRYEKTAELYGKHSVPTTSLTTLYYWKRRYDWDIQVRADELDLYEQRMEAKRESARKIVERQTGYSKVMQSLGFNYLRQLIDEHGNLSKEGLAMLTPSEARRFILDGGKMELDLYGGEAKLELEDEEISFG